MASIAIILDDEFEDAEFDVPFQRLREAGHEVTVIGDERGRTLSGKRGNIQATVDLSADQAQAGDYDALVIPGGHSPDHLRLDSQLVEFTRAFMQADKPVAAICHGPQMLIEADSVRGRTLTSWPSVRTDLRNAGAEWIDRPLVEDANLITSRKPDDLEVFCDALLASLARAETAVV